MSLLVVGSVAFDAIKTPYGKTDKILGGAATYFSLSASFFTDVRVVGVVGEDFTKKEEDVFHARKIDISGITHEKGQSFFWSGEYGENVNEAKTLDTQLGVFGNFNPQVPARFNDSKFLFLANIDPVLQVNVRKQMSGAKFVGGDTMNYWINGSRQALGEMMKNVHALLINDTEAKMLAGDPSLARAAQKILEMGPEALVIKHGEYGATVFFRHGSFGAGRHPFRAPTLPIEAVTGSHRSRRQLCRRFHGIHCVAGKDHARGLQARHVLRWSDGIVRGGSVRHGETAEADARRD